MDLDTLGPRETVDTFSRRGRADVTMSRLDRDSDPCWFLNNVDVRTGTKIVALIGIFMRPAFLFIAMGYWLLGTTQPMRSGGLVLFLANFCLIPANYFLLFGAILEKRWLCILWVIIGIIIGITDFVVVIVFYSSIYFVLFQIIVLFITVYKIWVVVTFYLWITRKLEKAEDREFRFNTGLQTTDSSRVVVVIESEFLKHTPATMVQSESK